jgi:hypothetical protein
MILDSGFCRDAAEDKFEFLPKDPFPFGCTKFTVKIKDDPDFPNWSPSNFTAEFFHPVSHLMIMQGQVREDRFVRGSVYIRAEVSSVTMPWGAKVRHLVESLDAEADTSVLSRYIAGEFFHHTNNGLTFSGGIYYSHGDSDRRNFLLVMASGCCDVQKFEGTVYQNVEHVGCVETSGTFASLAMDCFKVKIGSSIELRGRNTKMVHTVTRPLDLYGPGLGSYDPPMQPDWDGKLVNSYAKPRKEYDTTLHEDEEDSDDD